MRVQYGERSMYSPQHRFKLNGSTLPRYKYVVFWTVWIVIVLVMVTPTYTVEHIENQDHVNVVAYCQRVAGNSIAFRVALHLFRSVYPSSPLYIHWDDDYAQPVSGANLITHNKNIIEKTKNVGTKQMFFASVASMEAYIQRLKTAAGFERNGWVLLLEDDVWVVSQIKRRQLQYDISGTCGGQLRKQCRECPSIIQAHSPNHQAFRNAECYGGCGGNYINSSRILALEGYQNVLEAILRAWGGPVPQDVMLSSVILADGGTIGDNPGYYEPEDFKKYLSNANSDQPNILHQMKHLYFMKYILD